MCDTAVAVPNYDSIIDRQQKRILELEADLARYTDKIRLLKTRAHESHHAAAMAAATAATHLSPDLRSPHMHHPMLAVHPAASPHPHQHPHSHPHLLHAPSPSPPPQSHAHFLPHARSMQQQHPAPAAAAAAAADVFAAHALAAARPQSLPQHVVIPDDDDRAGKTRYWTEMEHNQFLYAVKLFGPKNYVAISQFVATRTPKQVRTHAQKYQMKLEREAKKRRAQAAAVAAVAAPGTAAATAVAAASVAIGCEQQQKQHRLAGGVAERTFGAVGTASDAGEKCGAKSETDAAQSASTYPTDSEEIEILREDACSPVSTDEDDGDRVMVDVRDGRRNEKASGSHAPVALCAGLRKNGSLGNLADYDDFMRRISTAVQDSRGDGGGEMFDASSDDLDMDILHTHPKTEQFEDALLADI